MVSEPRKSEQWERMSKMLSIKRTVDVRVAEGEQGGAVESHDAIDHN